MNQGDAVRAAAVAFHASDDVTFDPDATVLPVTGGYQVQAWVFVPEMDPEQIY